MASKEERLVRSKRTSGETPEPGSSFSPDRIKLFAAEVRSEFGKVVWPGRKQTAATTMAVVVLVVVISFYLGAVDLLLGKVIGYVLR